MVAGKRRQKVEKKRGKRGKMSKNQKSKRTRKFGAVVVGPHNCPLK